MAGSEESLDVGPDGTLWIGATDPADGRVCGLRLARFDGADWDVWGRDDGIPDVGSVFWYGGCQEGIHTVAPDGSVWLAPLDFLAGRECSGVANFDGTTWTRHLPGLCVYDAAIAPDGTVWLQAGEVNSDVDGEPWYDFDPVGTYVITPEAAAGGE